MKYTKEELEKLELMRKYLGSIPFPLTHITRRKMTIKIEFEDVEQARKAFNLMMESGYGFIASYDGGRARYFEIDPELFEILKTSGYKIKIVYE